MRRPNVRCGSAGRTAGAAVVLAAVGALTLGACGGGSSGFSPSPAASSSGGATAGTPAGSAGGTPSAAPSPKVSLEKAGAAAVKKVADGTLISIELERHGTEWEAQVVAPDGTEHEVDVSASTGSVTSARADRDDTADRAKHRKRVADDKLGYADAAKKARAAVPDGRVTELNLDGRRGRTVWEADVRDRSGAKHEVKLDAANGDVLVNRPSTGDDDD